jgi:hypothetical protein
MENQETKKAEVKKVIKIAEAKAEIKSVKKAIAPKAATPKKVASKPVAATKPMPKAKVEAPKINKPTQILKPNVAPKVEAPKAPKAKSTLAKMMEAGNTTRKIVTKAGSKIIGSSIQTTKTVAGMYAKAGKKALEIGKELMGDTAKVVTNNQKTVNETAKKAFKETVDTIKDSHLIENPLKGILKGKKK